MKTEQTKIQQGDCLLLRVSKLPAGCKIIKHSRGAVLAEGEHHGHFHACAESDIAVLEAPNGVRYVENKSNEPRTFTHQEHKDVTVPPNSILRLGIVKEYDYFADMAKRVVD